MESYSQNAEIGIASCGHELLQDMLMGLPLGEESMHHMEQLAQGIASEGMKLLADGLLIVVSKGELF